MPRSHRWWWLRASGLSPARISPWSVDRGEQPTRGLVEREPLVLPGQALAETGQPLHIAPDGPRIRLRRGRDVIGLASNPLRPRITGVVRSTGRADVLLLRD